MFTNLVIFTDWEPGPCLSEGCSIPGQNKLGQLKKQWVLSKLRTCRSPASWGLASSPTKTPKTPPQCKDCKELENLVCGRIWLWRRRIWWATMQGVQRWSMWVSVCNSKGVANPMLKIWLSRMTAWKLWRRLLSRRLQTLSLSNRLQFSLWLLWRRAHWMLFWRLLKTLVLSHGLFQCQSAKMHSTVSQACVLYFQVLSDLQGHANEGCA